MSISKTFPILVLFFAALSAVHGQKDDKCKLQSVCFAVDQSGSISNSDFAKIKTFTVNIVNDIAKNSTKVSYSAYAFDSGSNVIKKSTKNKAEFVNTIKNYNRGSGGTNIRSGLQACFNELKGTTGNRVIMLATDGQDSSNPLGLKPAIENAGIGIVTVGIGSGVNVNLLKKLATKPEFYLQTSTANLVARSLLVAGKLCDVAGVAPKDSCDDAYDMCKFKFRTFNKVPTFKIGMKPDTPFTTRIISKKNPMIGVLNTNGIDIEFLSNGEFKSITKFGQPKLTPTHFKPFSLTYHPLASGIGHQTFTGNQLQVSKKKCVRVFFTNFQLVSDGKHPRVVGNVNNAMKKDMNCVVFKTA